MIDTVDTTDTAAATANDQLKHEVIQVLESILADARFAAAPQMSARNAKGSAGARLMSRPARRR